MLEGDIDNATRRILQARLNVIDMEKGKRQLEKSSRQIVKICLREILGTAVNLSIEYGKFQEQSPNAFLKKLQFVK